MGREGETHAQIFWHVGIQKKWFNLSKLGGGGGGQGNLDKIQKNSYFFRESVPECGNWWWSKWWCAPSARPVSAPHPLVDVKP